MKVRTKKVSPKKITLMLLLVAFILFLLDSGLTLYYVNNYYDLVGEGNPFARSEYGLLVIGLNILYFGVVYLAAYAFSHYQTIVLPAKNTKDYLKALYKSPHHHFIYACAGFIIICATFASRVVAIFDWMVFGSNPQGFMNSNYAQIRAMMPFGRYDFTIAFLVFFVAIPIFFHRQYRLSKQALFSSGDKNNARTPK